MNSEAGSPAAGPAAPWQEGFLAGAEARRQHVCGRRLPWAVPNPEASKPSVVDALVRLTENAARNQPPDTAERLLFGQLLGLHYLAPAKDGFLLRVLAPGGPRRVEQRRGLAEIARLVASGSVVYEP